MKILHIISQHPEQTGSGFYIQNMIRQCQDKGHTIHLIAGISGDQQPQLPFIAQSNCTFIQFDKGNLNFPIPGMSDVMPYPSSRFSALTASQIEAYFTAFKKVISRVAKRFQPDLIHSHHLWFASSIARETCPDVPMVTSCHSTDLRQYLQNDHLHKWITNIGKIDRILALSQTQRQDISHIHRVEKSRIDIVGGGYDSSRFSFASKTDVPPVEFLYAGKLSVAKGVPHLLKALHRVKNTATHLHLVGSGSGPERDECIELAKKVADKVTVHGPMEQKDLAQLMGQAHVFILPSFFEGLPLVLLEALSSGCRIICSDLPGCRELLEKAGPKIVRFIPKVVMENVDTPAADQHEPFINNIALCIEDMTKVTLKTPGLTQKDVASLTRQYSWQSVFVRVEEAYHKAINAA